MLPVLVACLATNMSHWSYSTVARDCVLRAMQLAKTIDEERKTQGEIINTLVCWKGSLQQLTSTSQSDMCTAAHHAACLAATQVSGLYMAAGMSFKALPDLITNSSCHSCFLQAPCVTVCLSMSKAEQWFKCKCSCKLCPIPVLAGRNYGAC